MVNDFIILILFPLTGILTLVKIKNFSEITYKNSKFKVVHFFNLQHLFALIIGELCLLIKIVFLIVSLTEDGYNIPAPILKYDKVNLEEDHYTWAIFQVLYLIIVEYIPLLSFMVSLYMSFRNQRKIFMKSMEEKFRIQNENIATSSEE